jgi:uncharacterized protein
LAERSARCGHPARSSADPQFDEPPKESHCEQIIIDHLGLRLNNAPADSWRKGVVSWTWRIKVLMHLETELMGTVRERAEDEAINVFARNLHDLLMAAPAGLRATMGLDPGLRTGVKVAVVDGTGKLVATDTIYPHTGQAAKAAVAVAALCEKYNVELVAIGNGTASRETERFYLDVQKQFPKVTAQKVIVSEAGASVYSASELAALEFPDLDVSLRGAVSIARRLQDPLAELVKIDPKSIGVGQYQHDVSQTQLARKLDAVVEDCVNAVGVDLNTASVPLLTRVAGLTRMMAQNIVTLYGHSILACLHFYPLRPGPLLRMTRLSYRPAAHTAAWRKWPKPPGLLNSQILNNRFRAVKS